MRTMADIWMGDTTYRQAVAERRLTVIGPRAQTKKCSKISGDTSGNYHPHGDAVIYPTLVRLGQGWNMPGSQQGLWALLIWGRCLLNGRDS